MSRQDRRKETRYPPAVTQAQIGWWEGKQFRTSPARIEDFSSGGAALAVDRESGSTQSFWLCLADQVPVQWVQARLVGATTDEAGAQRVRLSFAEPCPYEVFKVAVWGEPSGPSPRPPATATSPGATDRPAATTGDRPPPDVGRPRGDVLTCVLLATPDSWVPPTLVEAEYSRRASRDRVGALPWVVASVLSLIVAALLGAVVIKNLGSFRFAEALPGTSRH